MNNINFYDVMTVQTDGITILNTESVIGATITKYYGTVSSNSVIGTNIFADMIASLSDVVGGNSGVYESRLQRMYNECLEKLARKAKWYGANCILGLKVDTGEISGKGKSMFMVSMVGTAVTIEDTNGVISHKQPEVEFPDCIKSFTNLTGQDSVISKEDKEFINLVDELNGELWTMAAAAESTSEEEFNNMYGCDVSASIDDVINDYTSRFSEISRTIPDEILRIKSKEDLIKWSNK